MKKLLVSLFHMSMLLRIVPPVFGVPSIPVFPHRIEGDRLDILLSDFQFYTFCYPNFINEILVMGYNQYSSLIIFDRIGKYGKT